jgi:hypothetical protein
MADNSLRYRTNPVFPRTRQPTQYAAPAAVSPSGYDPNNRSFSDSNTDPLAELARLVGEVDPYGDTGTAGGTSSYQAGNMPRDSYPLSPAQSGHWDAPPLAETGYQTAEDEAYAAEDEYAVDDEAYDQADYDDDQQQSDDHVDDEHASADQHYATGQDDYAVHADPYAPYADTEAPRTNRKTLLMAGAVFGLLLVGAVGAYAYRTLVGTAPSVPPVIMADNSPAKIAVTPSDNGSGKQIVDRVGDKPQNERVVPREEQPVDLKLSAPQAPVPATGWPAQPQGPPLTGAAPGPTSGPTLAEPHSVRTVAIAGTGAPVAPGAAAPPASAPVANAPAPASPAAPQRVATQGETPKSPAPAHTAVARYVVQISASNTREEAAAALRAAQARYGDVLGGRHSQVREKKSADKATVFAAQFGPFASHAEAAELCQRLKSAGGTCFVQ